jgi:hypothetical protein
MIPERNKSNYKLQRFEMRNKFYKQQIPTNDIQRCPRNSRTASKKK